jgi:hypothetical protein
LEACGFESIGEPFRRWASEEMAIDITKGDGDIYFARFIRRYRKSGNATYSDKTGPYIEMIFCPNTFKHLHQLMNFWHSITGSELTVNLEKINL